MYFNKAKTRYKNNPSIPQEPTSTSAPRQVNKSRWMEQTARTDSKWLKLKVIDIQLLEVSDF